MGTIEIINAVAAAVKKAVMPTTVEVTDPHTGAETTLVVVHGTNGEISYEDRRHNLEAWRRDKLQPTRRSGDAQMYDLDSFIAHIKRESDDGSAVFGSRGNGKPVLQAVYDYNKADGTARFREHRATYAFPISEAWKAWTESNTRSFSQAEFAEFIESRLLDIADPSQASPAVVTMLGKIDAVLAGPAKMLELSRGLDVRQSCRVASSMKLSSGESRLVFEAENRDSNGEVLSVPSAFLLVLPLFEGGPAYGVPVRLRYSVRSGQVTWTYSLFRTDEIISFALDAAIKRVSEETGLPVFFGRPEQ